MSKPESFFVLTILAVCLGPFQSLGVHFNALAQPQELIQTFINESFATNYGISLTEKQLKLAFGLLSATHYAVGIFGVLLCRTLIDRIGRRFVIFCAEPAFNLAATIFFFSSRYANRFEFLYISRAFFGIDWGMQMVALSTYVTEVSPPNYRGRAACIIMLIAGIGAAISFLIGLPSLLGTAELWNYQILLAVPSYLVCLFGYYKVPESPKFLYFDKRRKEEALCLIGRLYGSEETLTGIEKSLIQEYDQCTKEESFTQIARNSALRTTMILAVLLSVASITNGGIVLNHYSYILYTSDLAMSSWSASKVMAGVMCFMLLLNLVGSLLIDRVGRRPLVLFGLFGNSILAVLYVITSVFYEQNPSYSWLLYCSIALVISMQGMMPLCLVMVTYFTIGEITPHAARSQTMALATYSAIISRIVYYFVFPILQSAVGVYTLLILITIPCSAIATYLAFELPETKKRPVHEIYQQIMIRKSTELELDCDA